MRKPIFASPLDRPLAGARLGPEQRRADGQRAEEQEIFQFLPTVLTFFLKISSGFALFEQPGFVLSEMPDACQDSRTNTRLFRLNRKTAGIGRVKGSSPNWSLFDIPQELVGPS